MEAYWRLLDENRETLSEAVRTIVGEVTGAAFTRCLAPYISYQKEELDEAMKKASVAAAQLTGRDRDLLMELTRRALVASASIDLFDEETLVGHRVYRSDLHRFYRTLAGMIKDTLRAQPRRERLADQEPRDDSDVPF